MKSSARPNTSPKIRERTRGFHLDALRISFAMAKVAYERLTKTLNLVETFQGDSAKFNPELATILLDSWSLLDVLHRVREIAVQCPLISTKTPCVQIFLRKTKSIEELRHHVQHFRSGIHKLPETTSPLFGTISWVSSSNPKKSFSFISGYLHPDIESDSCTYDTYENKYCQQILLSAGGQEVDLQVAYESLLTFQSVLIKTLGDAFNGGLGTILAFEMPNMNRAPHQIPASS
jgi:hypothetical protein